MPTSSVAGLSLIMETNEEVDEAANLLRAVGLEVAGEDGYVQVTGPSLTLSIMRGAMVDVPRNGGLLVQVAVSDVAVASTAAEQAGATLALAPDAEGENKSAFLQSPMGFTLELTSG